MYIFKEFYKTTRLRLKCRYAFLVGWRGRGGQRRLGGRGRRNQPSVAGRSALGGCWVVQLPGCFCNPIGCSPPGSFVYGIFQQECWSGLPRPTPGDLSDQGIQLMFPALAGRFFTAEPQGSTGPLLWPKMTFCCKTELSLQHSRTSFQN